MGKNDAWIVEVRCKWGWLKQERLFNSYEEAEEVCDNLGYLPSEYRITRIKNKQKKFRNFFKNLLTNE